VMRPREWRETQATSSDPERPREGINRTMHRPANQAAAFRAIDIHRLLS
jgi:hypothetical protein